MAEKQSLVSRLTKSPGLVGHAKKVISVLVLLVLMTSLAIGINLIRQRQDLRRLAAENGVDLSLIVVKDSVTTNEEFQVNVFVDTKEHTVSAVELHLLFNQDLLEIKNVQTSDFLPTVLQNKIDGNAIAIILGSQPTNPRQGTGVLATLTFQARNTPGVAEISFDTNSQVAVIGREINTAGNLPPLSIEIKPIPISTPTSVPTSTPIPISTPTSAPTPTLPGATPTSSPTGEPTSAPTQPPGKIIGDVNNDGEFSLGDYNKLIEILRDKYNNGIDDLAGDVNGDKQLSMADYAELIKLLREKYR